MSHAEGIQEALAVYGVKTAIEGHNPATSLQYWKDYLNHSALNAGQAARDVRYLTNHPDAAAVATEGSARHRLESLKHRIPSLANNIKYTILPPQWHHAPDDLMNMSHATPKQWFLSGYAPWKHKVPSDTYVAPLDPRGEKLGFWKLADGDGAYKSADHVQDRRQERTPFISKQQIENLRADALDLDTPPGSYHTPLKDRHGNLVGHAVFQTIDGRLIMKTILGKTMTPKGTSLSHVLAVKTAADEHNPATSLQYWKDYLNHSALNAGQAARDVRYLTDHPAANAVAPKGSVRHMIESVKHRIPSLANNAKYTVLPPQWHHAPDELMDMDKSTAKQWFLHGYKPWEHKLGFAKLADIDTDLQPHQQRVVDRLLQADQPGLVAMHGMGSGKTLTSIAAANALGLPADVVLPAALRANYQKELQKHAPHGAPETHIQSLENVARKQTHLQNPFLIVDEAHRSRNPTKTRQALKNNEAQKRLLLTGSLFYNSPSDAAGPINLAAGSSVLPEDPDEFKRMYVSETHDEPGVLAALMGQQAHAHYGVNPQRKAQLQAILNKYVDYHPGSTTDFPTRTDETIGVPMGTRQKEIYDTILGNAPKWVHDRVTSGLPPRKSEVAQLNRFLQGTRQVSNSTAPYHLDRPPDQPKIDRAVQELQALLAKNPQAKALIYSNYLDAGINPYRTRLDELKIPYGEFTGAVTRAKRDQIVQDYNANKLRALLLSRAGGEGLDLKGTRLIQLLEPGWNEEGLKQVAGRGIRYQSHAGLPEDQRTVNVQHYLAQNPRQSFMERLYLRDPERSVDQYLLGLAQQKEHLNQKFRGLLIEGQTS